jgi:hypothetical protein
MNVIETCFGSLERRESAHGIMLRKFERTRKGFMYSTIVLLVIQELTPYYRPCSLLKIVVSKDGEAEHCRGSHVF